MASTKVVYLSRFLRSPGVSIKSCRNFGAIVPRIQRSNKAALAQKKPQLLTWSSLATVKNVSTNTGVIPEEAGMIFRQLFHYETYTYTYILACPKTREAVIIDPVDDMVERDLNYIKELGLYLVYGINTHVHADHVTGTGKLKEALPNMKSVISAKSGAKADKSIEHGNIITFGTEYLECRETPGHTAGCTSYVSHDHKMVFTGDAILIRACGRTDFQQGNPSRLYDSVHKQIFTLPDIYQLFPGHDYRGFTVSTVAEEKSLNPRLTLPKEKFIEFMRELNLAYPKLIDVSVPANLKCGSISKESIVGSQAIMDKIIR